MSLQIDFSKKEKETKKEVDHLKGVHEGMLLQALFTREGDRGILLAKSGPLPIFKW